ncbi:hypothetical protein NMG60_11031593 [Bertholletia excelsa]
MVMQENNLQEDMGEGSMLCSDHPYKNSAAPGGICALCLQEKLGKLVSSSSSSPFPSAVFPSSSSSPSPSFRSHFSSSAAPSSSSSTAPINSGNHHHCCKRSRIPFFSHKKKTKDLALAGAPARAGVVFSRSRSTVAGRRRFKDVEEHSPRRKGFWSFLHPVKHPSAVGESPAAERARVASGGGGQREELVVVVVDENESPETAALDRKVSRSRSVGCGSRSFSGDFFERISTGFGDCTLRRVESQREGKPKGAVTAAHRRSVAAERVKCGGIFGGFMVNSSSSSSSSSSYWMSSSVEENNVNGKAALAAGGAAHGRSRSWGWALASPMRAFSKPSSTKRETSSNKNTTPNLNAIPSLLAVGG